MKKIAISILLSIIMTLSSLSGGMYHGINNTISVSAAHTINSQKPKLTVMQRTSAAVTLSYSKVSGALGYRIYRASKPDGTYEYVGSSKTLSFTDKGLKYNKAYYYRVRAYADINEKKEYSKYSNIVSVDATFNKVKLQVKESAADYIKLTWTSVSKSEKYKIYRADSKDGEYEYVGIVTGTEFTDSNLDSDTTYYYRVRAYKKISGVKYNGVYSDKIKATTKIPSDEVQNEYARQVLELVNKERKKAGLSILTMAEELISPANERAKEIKELFEHIRPDGRPWYTVLDDYDISRKGSGENIAYGYKTPEQVMEAWMDSPGHKENILREGYEQLGVGVYVEDDIVYWVQLFLKTK